MHRYLRFVTTVGDEQPTQLEEEELHVNSEELSSATGQYPPTLTFRESLQRLYCSDRFQVYHPDLSVVVFRLPFKAGLSCESLKFQSKTQVSISHRWLGINQNPSTIGHICYSVPEEVPAL